MGSSYTNILRENLLAQVDIENHKVHSTSFLYTIKAYLCFSYQSLCYFHALGPHMPSGIFYAPGSWPMDLLYSMFTRGCFAGKMIKIFPNRRLFVAKRIQWLLVIFSDLALNVGQFVFIILRSFYFDNGGSSGWISTLMQLGGCP